MSSLAALLQNVLDADEAFSAQIMHHFPRIKGFLRLTKTFPQKLKNYVLLRCFFLLLAKIIHRIVTTCGLLSKCYVHHLPLSTVITPPM